MYMTETEKIKNLMPEIFEKYIKGNGIDLGCGDYKVSEDAIGIDRRPLKNVNIVSEIKNLKIFEDNEFDYVYTSHFLEHLLNPLEILSEIKRVLKNDGILFVILPDKNLYLEPNPEHLNMWSKDEFKEVITNFDFEIVEEFEKIAEYSFIFVCKKKNKGGK